MSDLIFASASVVIGGSTISNDDIQNLNVHCGATKEVSSFTITLNNNAGLYGVPIGTIIAKGDPVSISLGRGTMHQLFTGTVEDLDQIRTNMNRTLTVTGRCLGKQFFNKLVTGDFINIYPHQLVAYLIDNYTSLSHTRNSTELIEAATNIITEVEYTEKPVFDILTEIAAAAVSSTGVIGYSFRVASDGYFEFYPTGTKTNSAALTDSNIESANPTSRSSRIRNKIRVWGSNTKCYPLDQDGATEALTNSYGAWTGTATLNATNAHVKTAVTR
jgi:hypothetical protein